MRDLILEKVADAAELLSLPRERVMTKSAKDNLTLPRPRIELDFLPETYNRTGRLLGSQPAGAQNICAKTIRKELYEISLPVAAQILADDPTWLKEFCYRLAAALPRGFNDSLGNYVKLEAAQGQWEGFTLKRVGNAVIDPIVKRGYILHLNALWRVTKNELQNYITAVDFKSITKIAGVNI